MKTPKDELVDVMVYPVLEEAGLPRPDRVVRVAEGIGNHVYFVGDDLVVRIGTGTDGTKFPRAISVLRAASNVVRVPKILHADTTRRLVGYPVVVLERLPGRPLSRVWFDLDTQERVSALKAVTTELDRLHTLPATAAPEAGFSDPWWRPRVTYIERELGRHRNSGTFPAEWLDRMERYLDDHRGALTSAPRVGLLHGDPGWGNVLFDNGLTGLIDFDETRYGPAEEDYWQVLFETDLEATRWMPLARLRELSGFDPAAPGVLERFILRETENIFLLLSGTLSWKTPEVAREDAIETYRDAFERERFPRLLEELAR